MARIDRHPGVEDYFLQISLPQVIDRGGIADAFETGHLIILKDYRLEADFAAFEGLSKSIDEVDDAGLRKRLKKLTAPNFFQGSKPRESKGRLIFDDPLRQTLFDVLCRGDAEVFKRAARALKQAHDEVLRIFEICFPDYEPFRLIPSVRLTRTLFENLHWDNHNIDDDFHQARVFANLDARPRIWNVGQTFPEWARENYDEHDLGRFAGEDPNLMINYITGDLMGGTRRTWMENEPRHRIAFDPGEVWLGESRLISHQIYYGEAAMVYMWFVDTSSMADPANRFNERVERLHREMQSRAREVR